MIKRPYLTIPAMLVFALLGCSSFNSYQYPPPIVVVGNTDTPSAPATAITVADACVYPRRERDTPPEVPLKELAKVDPFDDAALDAIQQKHIRELRAFIQQERKAEEDAYQAYLKRCENYLRMTVKNTG